MKKKSVKKRIFLSNTLMVIVTLVIFLVINLIVIREYTKSLEQEFHNASRREAHMGKNSDRDLDDNIEDWTVERDEFYIIFGVDGILCIISLVAVSQIFTKNLTSHLMKPLDALTEATNRVRKNNLSEDIHYSGDLEFENVCNAFNDMQAAILAGQEQNRKYEKARTDMIAGISHDLRTPLTAIRGTIKGLMDGVAATPEMQEKFLETAYRRTGEMDVLLNQLLYLSRMETGKVQLSMEMIEISSYMKRYVHSSQELADAGSKETIILNTNNISETVQLDPEQFQRILNNLLTNSRKYAGVSPLVITIGLERVRGGIRLSFHDNGQGVPEEKLSHIFEEFYRADESRNKEKGNGLGLYIAKYLTEAMGGRIWAENRDGFTVTIDLPAASSHT